MTPSNPILHTARLYALYQQAAPTYCWDHHVPFYEAWDLAVVRCASGISFMGK